MSAEPDCDVLDLRARAGRAAARPAARPRRASRSSRSTRRRKPFELPRAAVVDDEVLRIFQAAGVERQILAESQVQEEVSFVTGAGPGTAACCSPVDGSQGHPPLVSIHQPSIERTLIAALAEQETVRTAWGRRLELLDQDRDGVRAMVRSVEDGCDSRRSALDGRSAATAAAVGSASCSGSSSAVPPSGSAGS